MSTRRFGLSMEMSRLTRDGISRDQILRREQGQGIRFHFPCSASADHEQDFGNLTRLILIALLALCDDHSPVQQTTSGIGHRVK